MKTQTEKRKMQNAINNRFKAVCNHLINEGQAASYLEISRRLEQSYPHYISAIGNPKNKRDASAPLISIAAKNLNFNLNYIFFGEGEMIIQ